MLFEALASGTGGGEWSYIVLMKAPLNAYIKLDDGDEEAEAYGAGVDTLIGIPLHNGSSAYTLTVTMNGLTAPTQTVNTPADTTPSGGISDVITVDFAKVHITFDDNFKGQTISITDGTHTASPAPTIPNETGVNTMDIYLPYTGDWTMTANDPVSGNDFNVKPDPVTITSLTQVISNGGLFVIPDGSTVTPTDDIETWLLCGDIKDKSYTTLAEVLADEETLFKLLTSDNANDYLKRSKTWIKRVKVPSMTSMTDPEGEVICISDYYGNSAWKVFSENGGPWYSTTGINGAWIGYGFVNPVKIVRFGDGLCYCDNNGSISSFKLQATNNKDDSSSWVDLTENVSLGYGSGTHTFGAYDVTKNAGEYKYYRVMFAGAGDAHIDKMQFYGTNGITDSELAMQIIGADDYASETLLSDSDWLDGICNSEYFDDVLNAKVPTMTDYTVPSGEVIESRHANSYYGWKSFDGDLASSDDGWYPGDNTGYPQHLGYNFGRPVSIKYLFMMQEVATPMYFRDITLQGSNDGFVSDIKDIESFVETNLTAGAKTYHIIDQDDSYSSYRILFTGGPSNSVSIQELQFYCREAAGVQTWLKAADIQKPYTTVAEVLADHATLQKLISNHDAVDYLVTAKGFIDDICSDATAMRYIGLRNYAADTLLADNDWYNAITKSPYVTSVFNIFVPKMESDTTPEGECFANDYVNANFAPWKAFNGNDTDYWQENQAYWTVDGHVGYGFTKPVVITAVKIISPGTLFYVEGSNSKTSGWVTLGDAPNDGVVTPINNTTAYQYYRIRFKNYASGAAGYVYTCQFYGREDVDETKISIRSAVLDNDIYYLDSNENPITVGATGSDGYGVVDRGNLPNGTYTFYSSVAKDTSDLSKDYSKELIIDDDTIEIDLVPYNSLLWYGVDGGLGTMDINPILRQHTGLPSVTPSIVGSAYKLSLYESSTGWGGFTKQLSKKAIDFSDVSAIKIVCSGGVSHSDEFWSLPLTESPVTYIEYASNGRVPLTSPSPVTAPTLTGGDVVQTIDVSSLSQQLCVNVGTWVDQTAWIAIKALWLE